MDSGREVTGSQTLKRRKELIGLGKVGSFKVCILVAVRAPGESGCEGSGQRGGGGRRTWVARCWNARFSLGCLVSCEISNKITSDRRGYRSQGPERREGKGEPPLLQGGGVQAKEGAMGQGQMGRSHRI